MWPGRPPARSRMSLTRWRMYGGLARSTAGSRFPCTATSWPTLAQAASRSTRQSSPITSPPAERRSGSSAAVPGPKWMTGAPGVSARIRARMCGRPNVRHAPGRLEDERHRGVDVDPREVVDLSLAAQGAPDDGPLATRELEPDVERLDDQEDVGEQDRRVDAQTVDGLERDLRRRLRVPAELEKPEPLPHRTVLGQVTACLAHQPHGGVRHRRAARGAQEGTVWK